MINKDIIYFGDSVTAVCDGKCDKAWGRNTRPKVYEDEDNDPDDFYYVADGDLGTAPTDPGTYEGGYAKPGDGCEKMNKWCVRECERSRLVGGRYGDDPENDFNRRVYNCSAKQAEYDSTHD